MKLSETRISPGGLLRCCIETINTLDPTAEYSDG